MLGRKCTDDGNKFEDIAIEDMHLSDALQAELEPCREALLEAVAETSEEFMDRYFEGGEFTIDEIIDASDRMSMTAILFRFSAVPVFTISALRIS